MKMWTGAASSTLSDYMAHMAHGPFKPCTGSRSNSYLKKIINDYMSGPLTKTLSVKSARTCCNAQVALT